MPYNAQSSKDYQEMYCNASLIRGTYMGEIITNVDWECTPPSYIVTTEKKGEEELDYYSVNGDVVEAASTGDVFLYLSGMYYNLSSGRTEMRGRKSIRRQDGPLKKLSNISNSGDLFKEAVTETHSSIQEVLDEIPF